MRMRQSSLGSADDCLRKFQYQLEQPPEVYICGSVRATGTAYHSALELLYGWRVNPLTDDEQRFLSDPTARVEALFAEATASFLSEMDRAGDYWSWDDKIPSMRDAESTLWNMLTVYVNQNLEWSAAHSVYGVEVGFEFPWFADHTKSGTMDLVLVDPFGAVFGVDHKTAARMWPAGKEHPRKNNQASWYTGALQQMFPDAPAHHFCFDVMTYAGKFERRIVTAAPQHVEAVEAKAIQITSLYSWARAAGLDLPANPSSTLCSDKYCDYFSICPHGSVLS